MNSPPLVCGIGSSVHGVNGSVKGLDRALAGLVEAGCTHAEVSPSNLHVTIAGRDNRARMDEVAEVCARHRLAYTLHAPVALNFMEEMHATMHAMVMRSTLAFAARIGASVVVLHPGNVHPHADRADRRRLLAVERDQMLRAADEAGRHGIQIAMETLSPNGAMNDGRAWSYALDPRALAEQIAAIAHPAVCGTLDFGHSWVSAHHLGFDYADALRAFAPYVGHMHLTDNCGLPQTYGADGLELISYGLGDLHLPLGWGTIPYEQLIPQLPIRPNSIGIVEIKAHFLDELGDSVAAAKRLADRFNGKA